LILWIGAQLSPDLASWITSSFGVEAHPVRELGLQKAKDREIYQAARKARAVVMTKDGDFLELLERLGSPPQVLWVTCGNTSNERLIQVLQSTLPEALKLLEQGMPLVEISEAK
jgi:predicted nuclease of predicted toxin-antitoxin system